MRKPIIVFSLVMMLAPLPTFIPWVYDTWKSEENTSWHAAPPSHYRTTAYTSMDDGTPWPMNSSAVSLDEIATGNIVWKEGLGCAGLRDESMLLTKLFYY